VGAGAKVNEKVLRIKIVFIKSVKINLKLSSDKALAWLGKLLFIKMIQLALLFSGCIKNKNIKKKIIQLSSNSDKIKRAEMELGGGGGPRTPIFFKIL
jgi:nanoRNase/pAp phosphatase (c-di-AMP/oligoRNAs hydrolase)